MYKSTNCLYSHLCTTLPCAFEASPSKVMRLALKKKTQRKDEKYKRIKMYCDMPTHDELEFQASLLNNNSKKKKKASHLPLCHA